MPETSYLDKLLIRRMVLQFKSSTSTVLDEECHPTYLVVPHLYYTGDSHTQYCTERDSQKQKLYDAEAEVFGYRGESMGRNFGTIKNTRDFIEKEIFQDTWFRACFGNHSKVYDMEINQTWGSRSRYYVGSRNEMRISSDRGFYEKTILHELSHCLVPPKCFAPHGPLFAAIYLSLVSKFMGNNKAQELAKQFLLNKVKFTPFNEFQYDFDF